MLGVGGQVGGQVGGGVGWGVGGGVGCWGWGGGWVGQGAPLWVLQMKVSEHLTPCVPGR